MIQFELSVVVVFFFALAHRNHAAVGHFAFHVLELDGGVVDAEVVVQAVFHVAQDALADRRWNIRNRDVTGQRTSLRADAPAV